MAFILPLLLVAAMYMLVMRPQQRRVRAHAELMSQVEVGDEIITAGGVFGRVTRLDDDTMQVEIAPGVEITTLRRMVMDRLVEPADDEEPPAYDESSEDDSGHTVDESGQP
jgi:preprotein translocase subunit YajC